MHTYALLLLSNLLLITAIRIRHTYVHLVEPGFERLVFSVAFSSRKGTSETAMALQKEASRHGRGGSPSAFVASEAQLSRLQVFVPLHVD